MRTVNKLVTVEIDGNIARLLKKGEQIAIFDAEASELLVKCKFIKINNTLSFKNDEYKTNTHVKVLLGVDPNHKIKHINGDRYDFRRSNIELMSYGYGQEIISNDDGSIVVNKNNKYLGTYDKAMEGQLSSHNIFIVNGVPHYTNGGERINIKYLIKETLPADASKHIDFSKRLRHINGDNLDYRVENLSSDSVTMDDTGSNAAYMKAYHKKNNDDIMASVDRFTCTIMNDVESKYKTVITLTESDFHETMFSLLELNTHPQAAKYIKKYARAIVAYSHFNDESYIRALPEIKKSKTDITMEVLLKELKTKIDSLDTIEELC